MSTTTSTADENEINKWLKSGNIQKLEQAVLDGHGAQLRGRTSRIPKINNFLKKVPDFQAKIEAIHLAIAQGKLRDVQALVDRKKLAMCRTQTGASPLHTAVLHKQAPIAKYIVDKFPTAIQARDNHGRTPLHYAAVINDGGNLYRSLLDYGADKKAIDVRGKMPDYYTENPEELPLKMLKEKLQTRMQIRSERMGNLNIIPTIPPSKLEVRQYIQKEDLTKLEHIVLSGFGSRLVGETSINSRIKEFLENVPDYMIKVAQMQIAAADGSMREVRNLLDRKTMAIARDPYGANILHKAVVHNHHDIVKYVVDNFPETINAKDHDGRTPLHYSVAAEDERIYKTLVGAQADETITDNAGRVADYYKENLEQLEIDKVIQRDNELAIKGRENPQILLITPNDANHRQMAKTEDQAQQMAMTTHNVRQWIRAGDTNKLEQIVLDGQGMRLVGETAVDSRTRSFLKQVPNYMAKIEMLHEAVATGNQRDVRVLLDRRKLCLSKDPSGLGLLHKSLLYSHPSITRYICEKYPDSLTVRDYEGRTPLHYAAVIRDDGYAYHLLRDAGADPLAVDSRGNPAVYYREHPEELDLLELQNRINRIRSKLQANKKTSNGRLKSDSGFNITRANIRKWIHAEDVDKLNRVVLEGHGDKLLVETSNNTKVKEFLKTVPSLIASIREVHQAVNEGNIEELKPKIEDRQMLMSKDTGGITPLHRAVIMGKRDMATYIVQALPETVKSKDEDGRTPLHYAAALTKDENVMYNMLVEAGADPKLADDRGRTPEYYQKHPAEAEIRALMVRLTRKPPEVNNNVPTIVRRQVPPSLRIPRKVAHPVALSPEHVSKLINQGDLDKLEQMVLEGHGKKLYGKTSWIEEVRSFLKRVPSYMDRIYAVHMAVANGDLRTVEELMDNKKLVIAKDDKGLTPLHRAVKYGRADLVRFMLEMNPAAVNVKDNEGRTPLHYAGLYKDRDDIYKILMNFEADQSLTDQKGKIADYYKQSNVKLEVKTPLRSEEADDNEEKSTEQDLSEELSQEEELEDKKVLKWIEEGDLGNLEQLIINGKGDLLLGKSSDKDNVQDFLEAVPAFMGKIRAIHNAGTDGDLKEMQSLLDRKVFAVAKDHFGACPLHKALLNGHTDVVRYLAYGFPKTLNVQDQDGRTPLHYAAVIGDGGLYFRLLHNYGADPNIKDKNGNTPGLYLRGRAVDFSYESLIKRYEEKKVPPRPPSVQRWERPPTEEILKALTPSPPPGEGDEDEMLLEQEEANENEDQPETAALEEATDAADVEIKVDEVKSEGNEEEPAEEVKEEPEPANDEEKTETPVAEEEAAAAAATEEEEPSENVENTEEKENEEEEEKEGKEEEAKNEGEAEITEKTAEENEAAAKPEEAEAKAQADEGEEPATEEPEAVEEPSADEVTAEAEPEPEEEKNEEEDGDKTKQAEGEEEENEESDHDNETQTENEREEEKATQTDSGSRTGASTRNNSRMSNRSENPIMWTKEGEYLASVMGDALIKALTDVSQRRPVDPITYLAMWLYRYALKSSTRQNTPNLESIDEDDPLMSSGISKEEMEKGSSQDGRSQPTFEDVSKIKDDDGQTLIHFAASKPHEVSAFWQLVVQSDTSMAERDANYNTARDIAENAGIQSNVDTIDKYVFEMVTTGKLAKMEDLVLNSYDHLLDIENGEQQNMIQVAEAEEQSEIAELLKGAEEFQEKVNQLHTTIRNGDVNEVLEAIDKKTAIAKNKRSRCSLHIAVLLEKQDIVEHIATNFPETIKIRDNMNRTALHYAMGLDSAKVIGKILVQAGASRKSSDVKYRTPSYYFVNKEEILQLKNEEESLKN